MWNALDEEGIFSVCKKDRQDKNYNKENFSFHKMLLCNYLSCGFILLQITTVNKSNVNKDSLAS